MSKTYYSFKLNLSGKTILQLEEEEKKSEALEKVLPDLLKTIINLEMKENNDRHFFNFQIESKNLFDDNDKAIYNLLEEKTKKLRIEYNKTLSENKKTGDVYYSKYFLDLNEECIKLRNRLENKVPLIKIIYDDITDEEADPRLEKNKKSKVKTGRTHLLKFEKIKMYVEEAKLETISGFYEPKTELFYLEKLNTFEMVKMQVNVIQKKINTDKGFNSSLGRVTIIEQYKKINLSESTKKIKFELVYPNTDLVGKMKNKKPKELNYDLDDILGTTGFNNFKGELSGGQMNLEKTESQLNNSAEKGYLLDIESSGLSKEYKETTF